MTECEWRNSTDPVAMYDAVRGRATTRQARLLMVACCRSMSAHFFDPRIPAIQEAAERCADDPEVESAAGAFWDRVVTSTGRPAPNGRHADLGEAILAAWDLVEDDPPGPDISTRVALASAVLMSVRGHPREVLTGGEADAAKCCVRDTQRVLRTRRVGQTTVPVLLRDIFGTLPFRPVPFSPALRTSAVTSLAGVMYESRDFGAAPILADALEEAGCDSADILNHLRGESVHVRGCWAVDLVLGRG